MKNLETLIQELCPDGVEFVKLGDVCEIKGRIGFRGYTRKDLVSESEGAITLSPSNIINGNIVYDKCSYISWAKYEESPEIMAEVGDVVFTKTASVGKTAYIENMPKEMTINPQLVLLKKFRGISKYLAYILKTTYFQNEVKKITGVGSVPNVPQSSLAKIEIPLPPIEVQTEIVRILDKFTSLEAEIEAELDCRKRQYEYYRDKLLSFDNVGGQEVEWKKMSEVSFYPKTRIDASELSDNSYIGVENLLKDKLGRTDSTVKPEGSVIQFVEKDILIGNIRPYLRKIWKSDCKGGTNGDVLCIRVKEPSEVSPDYLFHILSSEKFFLYDIKNSKGAKMPRGDKAAVMDFEIPVPTLEEQNRIVSILNRFESLTTSLQSGLPAEIAARRKQYEHYRDKLLTFKRKGAA